VPWSRWISSFETYILAAGLEGVSEGRRHALLLHSLGAEGQHVFGTLGTATMFTEMVELLRGHFAAPQSALLRRTIFRRRYQHAGESVTPYVADLWGLASLCNLGHCRTKWYMTNLLSIQTVPKLKKDCCWKKMT